MEQGRECEYQRNHVCCQCVAYWCVYMGQCLAVSQVEQGRECEYQRNHVCCQCVAYWCVYINAEGSVFSCESSGTGEGV